MSQVSRVFLSCLLISLLEFSRTASLIHNSNSVSNETLDSVTTSNPTLSPSIVIIPEKSELLEDTKDGSDENCTQNTKILALEAAVHLAQLPIEQNSSGSRDDQQQLSDGTTSLGANGPPTKESSEDIKTEMEGLTTTTDLPSEDSVQTRQGRKFKNKEQDSGSGGNSGGFFGFMRSGSGGRRGSGDRSGGGDKKDKKKNKFFGMF